MPPVRPASKIRKVARVRSEGSILSFSCSPLATFGWLAAGCIAGVRQGIALWYSKYLRAMNGSRYFAGKESPAATHRMTLL